MAKLKCLGLAVHLLGEGVVGTVAGMVGITATATLFTATTVVLRNRTLPDIACLGELLEEGGSVGFQLFK